MTNNKRQQITKDKIMKLGDVEIDQEPAFSLESKVRVRKKIRNDGTFPGKQIGETLANKGDEGYIIGIGTYLQTAYIYSVHFLESGNVVGCLGKELELITETGGNYVS
jgi:nitrogen fixation protein NifZ